MADDNSQSFNPKTWLDPKPGGKPSDAAPDEPGFDPKTWVGPPRAQEPHPAAPDEPGFDPKTWVSPGTMPAGGAAARGVAAGRGRAIAAALVAVGLASSAAFLLFGRGNDAEDEPAATVTSDPMAELAAMTEPAGALPEGTPQTLSVTGYSRLLQALLDWQVAPDEAALLARETLAALAFDETQTMQIDLRLVPSGEGQQVNYLSAILPSGAGVELTRRPDASYARRDTFAELRTEIRRVEGEMGDATFYAAAVSAGMPDKLITPFTNIFSYDFHFAREVDAGDRFVAVWEEEVRGDGEVIGNPRLLYARMVTGKGDRVYYAFVPPDGVEAQWFDANGQANVRNLMRTPVDGARVSSGFGMRFHPIHHTQRLHGGVDYAAPTGTPIYASGDAVMQFRARAGGAGKMVVLDHGEGMVTRYLHLNEFHDGVSVGQSVRQGEVIGYVGSTGASTGPHLHYEIIVDGEKKDPLTFETTKVEPLRGEALTMFRQQRARLDTQS